MQKIIELQRKIEELELVIKSISEDERKYRTMVEFANSIIINIDRQGRLTFINEYGEHFFGYSKLEILGKKIVGTIVPQRESSGRDLENLIAGIVASPEEFQNNENENTTKDGRRVWITWANKGMFDEEGKLIGVLGIGNDVTRLKGMEQILHKDKTEWEEIFNAISDWVTLLDTDRTVLRTNMAGERFLNLSMSEMKGKSCCMLVHGSSKTVENCPFLKALKTGKREQMQIKLKDEGTWLQISVDPVIEENGEIVNAVHIVRDITLQKNMEESVEESRKQLRALASHAESVREAERTRIAREIHDELGQTLTCIKIDISEIKKDLEGETHLREDIAEKAGNIMTYVDNTINTVRKISAELRPGILDDLGLEAAAQWLSGDFQRRTGIACNIRRSEAVPADREITTALYRILQESLTNVVRHADATSIEIDLFTENNSIVLIIRDDGKGFKEGIFNNSNSLGFLGMKERILPFGGNIEIHSKSGKGTEVKVKVPSRTFRQGLEE